MKPKTLNALNKALRSAADVRKSAILPVFSEPRWVYKRNDSGNWQGSFEQVPVPLPFLTHDPKIAEQLGEIQKALESEYPEYLKMVWVANAGGPLRPDYVLGRLMDLSWTRYHTFEPNSDQITEILAEAAKFFDLPFVRFHLLAPVIGLNGPTTASLTKFPSGVELRPLSEEECNTVYGRVLHSFSSLPLVLPDLVLAHDVDVPKQFNAPTATSMQPPFTKTQEGIDRALLTLISFKNVRAIGYDGIFCYPTSFCLALTGFTRMGGQEPYFPGVNTLTADDIPALQLHAASFERVDEHLDVAAHRLVDATNRRKDDEAIVDAVIGLESVLLHGEKAELRFKFALNYSILPFTKDRYREFQFAKALYDLRSTIVHGTRVKQDARFGPENLPLTQMADRARTGLRETLCFFVKSKRQAAFTASDYWVKQHLAAPLLKQNKNEDQPQT